MDSVTFEELPRLLHEYFGDKADIAAADSGSGEVTFILYESFLFKCGFDVRYGRFGLAMLLDGIAVRTFFGKRVTMENDRASLLSSFGDIERFCRLRLPEAFLAEFDASLRSR